MRSKSMVKSKFMMELGVCSRGMEAEAGGGTRKKGIGVGRAKDILVGRSNTLFQIWAC